MSVKNCFIRGSVVRYVQLPADECDTQLLQDTARKEASQSKQRWLSNLLLYFVHLCGIAVYTMWNLVISVGTFFVNNKETFFRSPYLLIPVIYFTKISWVHNSDLVRMLFAPTFILISRIFIHNFSYYQLSFSGMCKLVSWSHPYFSCKSNVYFYKLWVMIS